MFKESLKSFLFLCVCVCSVIFSTDANASETNNKEIIVNSVDIQGNTIFNDTELRSIISPLNNKEVTLERILQIREEITDYYTSQGYLLTGAFLPPQDISSGKIVIFIVEGTISKIKFDNQSNVNESYLLERLPKVNDIYNINTLSSLVEKLQDDPQIDSIDVEVSGDGKTGAELNINAKSTKRLTSTFSLTNNNSPSIGRNGGQADFQWNVFGYGDFLDLSYAKTKGLNKYSSRYSIPLEPDTKLFFQYTRARSELVDDLSSELDINADFNTYQLGIVHSLLDTKNHNVELEFDFSLINSESFILEDFSFAFVDGLENGENNISEISFKQRYKNKDLNRLFSLGSSFNLGLDIFDATVTEQGRDSLYWYWTGEAEKINKVSNKLLYISRVQLQLTPDKLLPIKQFSLGGVDSIRGYRRSFRVGDNGISISQELQYSLYQSEITQFKILTYLEAGNVWNNNSSDDLTQDNLASIGLGLQYLLSNYLNVSIDYGLPLISVEEAEANDLDSRINFRLLFTI